MELGVFEVGGQLLGIDVRQIREVVRPLPLTPLPGAPDPFEGLMDLRGAVFPVLDLGRALGLGPIRPEARSRIAVVEADGLVLGLRVAAALDVLAVEAEEAADGDAALPLDASILTAVVRRPSGAPVLVLSLPHVVQNLPGAGGDEAGSREARDRR